MHLVMRTVAVTKFRSMVQNEIQILQQQQQQLLLQTQSCLASHSPTYGLKMKFERESFVQAFFSRHGVT
jgi:hypothetical protein